MEPILDLLSSFKSVYETSLCQIDSSRGEASRARLVVQMKLELTEVEKQRFTVGQKT